MIIDHLEFEQPIFEIEAKIDERIGEKIDEKIEAKFEGINK